MKPAVDIVYRDFDASHTLTDTINKKVEKLTRFSDDILHSRVVLEMPHNHKHKGKQFRASVELSLKGAPVTVTHDDETIHIAVREAFSTAPHWWRTISAPGP